VILAFNKPYGVLSQFTPEPGSQWRTLAEFGLPPRVYPVGRLDADSEGLLLLSDEAAIVKAVLEGGHPREYWVQVEGILEEGPLRRLAEGVTIQDYRTLPAKARRLEAGQADWLPARLPPIRVRKAVPDCWISLELREGKNRQVRKMTAAVGHPTLRLVRVRIGRVALKELELKPGESRRVEARFL
jgi:23S rRNA pseudouridine2457 synthase